MTAVTEKSLAERILDYAYDVIEGHILACKKHIWACERFINDLQRIPEDSYPYYFDGDELEEFNLWVSQFKHTEGALAGQPIELNDWQLFVVANILCWKHKDTNNRRFRRAYVQVARKNGKSFLQALIASYVAFLSGEKEQVYIAGVTRDQSKIVYNQIIDQLRGVELLEGKYKTSYGKITHIRSGSFIEPLSKEAGKTGDGKFPSLAIIDELHRHPTSEIYDVMYSGMIGRRNALIVSITTAGLDLTTYGYDEYQYVSKVINPHNTEVQDEEYFVMICELDKDDDYTDPANYIKANPVIATYDWGMKELISRLNGVKGREDKLTEFLTKHMNIWVQRGRDTYMDLEKWNACGVETKDLPDLYGREVYVGVDLSATIDLTSVAFIVPVDSQKYVVLGHSFMPEGNIMERTKSDRGAKYDVWERQGWITATAGDVIDYEYVKDYIIRQVDKYNWNVKGIFYDTWNATQFSNDMQREGFITVQVRQGMQTLAPATKEFRDTVYRKKIIHNNNPVINWAFGNAIAKVDHNLNMMLDKKRSTQRIDPVAAIITAFVHAQFHFMDTSRGQEITDDYLDSLGW